MQINNRQLCTHKITTKDSEYYIVSFDVSGDDIMALVHSNRKYFCYEKDEVISFKKEEIENAVLEFDFGELFYDDNFCILTDEVYISLKKEKIA